MEPTGNVLILDGSSRQALSETRALGRRGCTVTVGESYITAVAKFSKYCSRRITYPDPNRKPDQFLACISRLTEEHSFDLIIPNSDLTVELLSRHKSAFESHTAVPLPDIDIVMKALDKSRTFAAAAAIGVPCPKTICVEQISEVMEVAGSIDYPAILKPRRSTGALGYRKVDSPAELVEEFENVSRVFPAPIIQEFIPDGGGKFTYGGIIGRRGTEKASFVHEYLRLYPHGAGVGTYGRSARHDGVREYGRRLLQSLPWYGVAEVEFKIDPRDNLPKLLEINPRFWGMSELAVAAGMDLPYHLYAMVVEQDEHPADEYESDVYLRWLIPGEVLHFLSNKDRWKLPPDFFKLIGTNNRYSILSKTDPLPVVGILLDSIFSLFRSGEVRDLIIRRR